MKVTFASIADYANVSEEGKLNLLGIFTTIGAMSFPCTHAAMVLVIELEADLLETVNQVQRVEVRLVDDSSNQLFSISGEVILRQTTSGELATAHAILRLQNVIFPREGTYLFQIFVGDKEAPDKEIRIKLLKTKEKA